MTKVYLVSEGVLRQVLDVQVALRNALWADGCNDELAGETLMAINKLRTILAKEPSEPVATLMRNETFRDMESLHWTPQTHWHETWKAHDLYLKDA
jgi:hypothetical protein